MCLIATNWKSNAKPIQVNSFWLGLLEKDQWIKLRKMLNLPVSRETIFAREVTAELLASCAIEWGGDTQPTARAPSHLWLAVSCTVAMKQSQSGHWPAKRLLPSN